MKADQFEVHSVAIYDYDWMFHRDKRTDLRVATKEDSVNLATELEGLFKKYGINVTTARARSYPSNLGELTFDNYQNPVE
jgi:hypothetical protein